MRKSFFVRSAVIALLLTLAGPMLRPEHACAQDRTRFLRWAYQDAGALAQSIAPRSYLLTAGGLVVLTPATRLGVDAPMLEEVQAGYVGPWGRYLDFTNTLGERKRMMRFSAGLFVASLATRNGRFQNAAFTSWQALVYADLITRTLKSVVGRVRPSAGMGPDRFRPFSGHHSFPSGHTTVAFAVMSAWVFSYPHTATYALLALSTGTAFARVAHNRHWPTDVFAGAAIGICTARFLVRRHRGHEATDGGFALRVAPYAGLRGAGLSLALSL